MKILIATVLVSAVVSLGSFAHWAFSRTHGTLPSEVVAATTPPTDAPPAQRGRVYIAEPVIQLGRVALNDKVRGSFTVINDGDRPVSLDQITKSCGCTSASFGAREIGPNGRAEVRFEILTGANRGPRAENIGVTIADGQGATLGPLVVRVAFTPSGIFDTEPAEVVLTPSHPQATVTIRSDQPEALKKVQRVESLFSGITVDSSKLPIVTLKLNGQSSEAILNTEFVIYTTEFGEEQIRVPVRVRK